MEKMQKVNSTKPDTLQREWAKVVAQAWADPDFRKRLERNPRAVLKERGVEVPADIDLSVIDKPAELQEIERAVRPIDMAVAAGFAAPPMPSPPPAQPIQAYPVQGFGGDYYTGGYMDPTYEAALYSGAMDPTLEAAKWKLGLCPNIKLTGGLCGYFHWGGAQPQPQGFPPPPQPQAFPSGPQPQGFPPGPQPQGFPPPPQPQGFPPSPQMPTLQPQMPMAPYAPPAQPQQPPTAAFAGGPHILPYYPGGVDDIYAGAADPSLEAAKWKLGLCPNIKATGGLCGYFHWGGAQPLPYYSGGMYDVYSGAADPTLEAAKWKLGLCPNVKATGGLCGYFHWGAAQPLPFPAPQMPTLQPQMPMAPTYPYPPPAQPQPPQQQQQPQQQPPTTAWAATVPTQCFSGAAAPPFIAPIMTRPAYPPQYYTQQTNPSPGPQPRPAMPGSA